MTKILDKFYSKYENITFLGDFDTGVLEIPMTLICEWPYDLKSIIKQLTCFKKPEKSRYWLEI